MRTLPLTTIAQQPTVDVADLLTSGVPTVALVSVSARGPTLRRGTVLCDGTVAERSGESERFTCLECIGVGGEGEVWRAFDRDLQRMVAVKRPQTPDLPRFTAEVRIAGALEHPGIVAVHDVGVDAAGHPYVVMRYVEGVSLETIIERLASGDRQTHIDFCFESRMQIFRKLCEALAFAHERGIVHCDIKPANVLVGRFGETFLTDWGISRRLGDEAAHLVAGTPAYMAPEQASGDVVDARSDVYGLCALLYELLTLRPSIDLPNATLVEVLLATAHHQPPHPSDLASSTQPRVPMDLGWFVMAGLAKDPARRYSSVASMLDRLERRAEGRVPIQCSQTLLKRSMGELMRFVEKHPFALPIFVLVMVASYVVLALRR